MLPSCTTCVPSCSLFPRSSGGKVMLPPLSSSQDCQITGSSDYRQDAPIEPLTTVHASCSCRHKDCMCPSSSSGRTLLQQEPAGNSFNGHDHVLHQRHSMNTHSDAAIIGPVKSSRQPPIPSPRDGQTMRTPAAAVSVSVPTDISISSQATAEAELTSRVRTFRFKNTSACGQNANRRETSSPGHRPSPSDTDGSLKEINVTRRAKRQIYLKPDVEDSPFRLLMYVDCRSVEPQPEVE